MFVVEHEHEHRRPDPTTSVEADQALRLTRCRIRGVEGE